MFPEVGLEILVEAKIRYAAAPAKAVVILQKDGKMKIKFDQPQRAITPGQSVVCYQGEYVICGGIIEKAL